METWKVLLFLLLEITKIPTIESKVKLCSRSRDDQLVDESMFSVDSIRRTFQAVHGEEFKNRGLNMYFTGQRKCPKSGFKRLSQPLLCPSYAVWNYDPDRIPTLVTEMKCSCQKCLSATEQSYIHSCQPVRYYRYVLRKEPNESCYRRTVEAFSVGCQCLGHVLVPFKKTPKGRS